MPKLIAIARLLLSPLLVILAACGVGGNNYTHSNRVANGGHDVLSSKARVQDGLARFECKASDSGWCHYTLYPDTCVAGKRCVEAPLQRFAVARGDSRQVAGLARFRLCVATDAAAVGADCQPAAPAKTR